MRFFYDFTTPMVVVGAVLIVLALLAFVGAQIAASFRRSRDRARFGEDALVVKLVTHDAALPRTLKGVFLVLGLAFVCVAFARPQFGRGSRLIPATNLDVVIVLDFSKSMYARDVAPSRISRAKAEVGDLVKRLPGARFGAVAFAGEPMSFPLTSDGAAITQFFRQLEPNDMPVGGTATARALERARELFSRDPRAKDHVRVIVLVTDGEDLEGDPLHVADACAQENTRIDVVQIGGRAPETVPEVGPDGRVLGPRTDERGKTLTTELTAEGEAQLTEVATRTRGKIVRARRGETGIEEIATGLARMMHEELSERVETVYDEAYQIPLGAGVFFLVLEALVMETPRRRRRSAEGRS